MRLGVDGARWGVPIPLSRTALARRRAERARVEEVIDLVGGGAYARRPIGELSGGEQQRLLIAQALVRRPELLILDEPLDSLDLPNQVSVAALIGRISHAEGISVLLVAHDVNPLLGHLDRVVYLAGGRALAGAVQEVITAPKLSRPVRSADRGAPDQRRPAGRGRAPRGPALPRPPPRRRGPLWRP